LATIVLINKIGRKFKQVKKIILAGASLNSGNRGVNALTRGQIMLICDKYGYDNEIEILSYTVKKEMVNKVFYNNKEIKIKETPCSKKKLIEAYVKSMSFGENYILKKIKSSDMVFDISEGDSFSDIYGVKRFIQHSIIKLIAINVNTKLIIMPQTLGPFNKRWVKVIARKILNKADKVFVRDEISKKVATEELLIQRDINYIPDMAFYMKSDNKISIDKFISGKKKVKVGINISALLYNGGYTKNNMFNLKADYKNLVTSLIEDFANMNDVEVILIPHVMVKEFQVEDDFSVCKKLAEDISKRIRVDIKTIDKYYREDEIKGIISGCDFFIGSRMHACIAAISTKVPTAPIAYSRKFIGIWDKLKLGNCVTDPINQNENEIIEKIIKIFNNRSKIKEILNLEIPLLQNQIENIVYMIEEK
jgi:polysaccharide pyruvyl transferase WcaK-like protein